MKAFAKTGILLLLILTTVLATTASAGWKPEVVIGPGLDSGRTPYHQDWHRTLSADTLYVLTGLYYVDSLASVTIEPGTVVVADTAATLIIARGADIHAVGEPQRPIVFTSLKDPGEREPGDWGGVIILGEAPINKVEPLIEGGIIGGTYGGNDPHDSSGEFAYVRIEYPGYRFAMDNEVNGLTMGGVGDGTEIHHVQISYSFDDSYEWFGGTVDGDYLVVMGGTDDVFDTDYGHAGKHQFCFAVRDMNYWDPTGQSNGFESDNDGTGSNDVPYTEPIFSNVTIVGPERTDALVGTIPPGHSYQFSGVIRRASKHKIFNSCITGFPWGFSVRDAQTQTWALTDEMKIRNTSITASLLEPGSSSVHQEDKWAGVTAWFDTPAYANYGSQPRNPSAVGLTDMSDLNDPNPVPAIGSELIGSADFTDPDLMGFEVVTYRGAFDPELPMEEQWTAGWTNFDPQNTDYRADAVGVENEVAFKGLSQNYPNPFNPVTKIAYSIRQAGPVEITVHNTAGKVVRTLLSDELETGATGFVVWDGTDSAGDKCASGVYFYSITAPDFSETHKMVMLK